jgi:hypothetical protein
MDSVRYSDDDASLGRREGNNMKTTTRRQLLARIPAAAMTSTATLAANGSRFTSTDPVFAAIEKHRQAVQAWQAAVGQKHEDDKISDQLMAVERDAWRAWLTNTAHHHGRRHRNTRARLTPPLPA